MPDPIKALCNKYETGMVALCGLFSNTVKKTSITSTCRGKSMLYQETRQALLWTVWVHGSDIFTNSPDLQMKNPMVM